MRMWRFVVVTLVLALVTTAHGKNGRLTDTARQRLASLAGHVKQALGSSNSALVQKLVTGAGIVVITCANISCSSNSLALHGVAQQQHQYVRAPEELLGRHVHFVVDGVDHIGYVTEAVSTNEVNIDLYDGVIVTVDTKQISGVRINEHPDERRQVLVRSDIEAVTSLHGFVLAVYDNGYYEIMVGAYVDANDNLQMLDNHRTILVPFAEILSVMGELSD